MPNFDAKKITTKDGKTIEVRVDRLLCTGCGSCVAVAPKVFGLDSAFKSTVLETAGEDLFETVLEAAKSCPVLAIMVKEKNGKQIFP